MTRIATRSVVAWCALFAMASAAPTQTDGAAPKAAKKPAAAAVPADVAAEIRQQAARRWRGNEKAKRREINEQMGAYAALKSYNPPGVPKFRLRQFLAEAQRKSPADYKQQKLDVEKQVKAWHVKEKVPE